ncbi:MAG: phosphatase PAP2 family protein [Candidatus Korobacteraceae bacterium]
MTLPTDFDLYVARLLARPLGSSDLFDYGVQSGIANGVFGGLWFAAALFVWYARLRSEEEASFRLFLRTVLAGFLAVLLTLVAAQGLTSIAPIHHRDLIGLFPEYMTRMPVRNSFPSQSTAIFVATALGILAFRRWLGISLLVAAFVLGSLSRMYVGGHFLSDVLAGAACGLAGFFLALAVNRVAPPVPVAFRPGGGREWITSLGAFLWILEIATNFQHIVWLQRALNVLRTGILPW